MEQEILEKISKNKSKLKILFIVLILVKVLYWVISTLYNEHLGDQSFFNSEIDGIIISSNSFKSRSVEYHTSDNQAVYFWPDSKKAPLIGDSIHKDSFSYKYKIYKKIQNSLDTIKYEIFDFRDIE